MAKGLRPPPPPLDWLGWPTLITLHLLLEPAPGSSHHSTCSSPRLAQVLPCAGTIAVERAPGTADAIARLQAALRELFCGVAQRGSAGALTVRASDGISVSQLVGGAGAHAAANALEWRVAPTPALRS